MSVTIQEIAQMCNVSRGTVDRVLHNRPNVQPAIRRTVMQAIKRTGYRLPGAEEDARQLQLGILTASGSDAQISDQYKAAIEQAGAQKDDSRFQIVSALLDDDSPVAVQGAIDHMLARNIDGLLVNLPMLEPVTMRLQELIDRGIPVMTCFNQLPRCAALCHIGPDAVRAGRTAAGLAAKFLPSSSHVLVVAEQMAFHSQRARAYTFQHHLTELGVEPERVTVLETRRHHMRASDRIYREMLENRKITCIYAASEAVTECAIALSRLLRGKECMVISGSSTAVSRALLAQGVVDFVVGTPFRTVLTRAVDIFHHTLRYHTPPAHTELFTELTILTRQML